MEVIPSEVFIQNFNKPEYNDKCSLFFFIIEQMIPKKTVPKKPKIIVFFLPKNFISDIIPLNIGQNAKIDIAFIV